IAFPPELASISDETVEEGEAITQVDAEDTHTGNDTDRDGDVISYVCYFDNSDDDTVGTGNACTALPGSVTWNGTTGVLDWTPDYSAYDNGPLYEIRISGTSGAD